MRAALLMNETGHQGTGDDLPRFHVPVLLSEAIEALKVQPGGRYIDCTLGSGGHARAILEAAAPGGQLLGIDADPRAIANSRSRLADYGRDVLLVNDNFSRVREVCVANRFHPVNGILFDLGLSSRQLEAEDRGFSFLRDSPLDMRFDPAQPLTAAEVINTYPERDLADLLREYGEEPQSRQIARQVVASRPIRTTLELVSAVLRGGGQRGGRTHPATRTFQALRIAVNRELQVLPAALEQAVDLLGFGGRLVAISYHSLEDRIVKRFLRRESTDCICPPAAPVCSCLHQARLRMVYKRAVMPSPAEVAANPRSRSARLRAAERT